MALTTLQVDLGRRSYPIVIGAGVINDPATLAVCVSATQLLIVTNDTIGALYLASLEERLAEAVPGARIETVILPDGEVHKTLSTVERIFDRLLELGYNRSCRIIALGGGVIGDMAGFAAACYQRGVGFVQIPTTLLAQVDSSVGGKTGVNHPLGKNMIGAFHQPDAVLIDLALLRSLPGRELAAGLAEVIKYGLIADAEFFTWLESNLGALLERDPDALRHAIARSCALKAEVVAGDEREAGRRAILNLGHTYGHAIETHMGYGAWLHGEAVAAGMVMACELSAALGWLDDGVTVRARELLQRAGLPVIPPEAMAAADFRRHMQVDKKVLDGKLRLVLLDRLGHALVTDQFDHAVFADHLQSVCGR